MTFKEFRGITQTDFLKTRPYLNIIVLALALIFYKIEQELTKKLMVEFSRNRSSSCPEIEISKKYWMSFPEIGLCHTLEY